MNLASEDNHAQFKYLLSSYIRGDLDGEFCSQIKAALKSDQSLSEEFQRLSSEYELLNDLIPNMEINNSTRSRIKAKIESVNESLYPKEDLSKAFSKIKRILLK